MILLDTSVVLEPMRPQADPAVQAWLDLQSPGTLFLTTTSLSKLLLGIEILPPDRRRGALDADLAILLYRLFPQRILPFDGEAAKAYARVAARCRHLGRPISVADGQVAAIAEVFGCPVATRDSLPFQTAGIPVINPWIADRD